jgi:subtilisin
MRRTEQTLAVLVVLAFVATVYGCGSAGGGPERGEASLGRGSAAPVVADAAGRAKVMIGFTRPAGPNHQALVEGQGGKTKYVYHLIPAIAATIPEKAVEGLRRNPNVAYVEGDGQVQALEDELVWGADQIDAETVWGGSEDAVNIAGGGPTGQGVKVAILDTGINHRHTDLSGNYAGGYDFVNADSDPMDDNGHGTHCAGIVAAQDDGRGIIQVAPKASLYGVKVLNENGGGSDSDVVAGLQWCVDNGMQVASMSFGGSEPSASLEAACDSAYGAGVLLVAAAGNSGSGEDTAKYPARHDSVMAIAATDPNNERASFSSTGPSVEVAAPGVNILSTVLKKYETKSGTSMACPHVSGVAALVMQATSGTAAEVRQQLGSTADDLGAPGRDEEYGYGLVNAVAALGLTPNSPPVVTITSPDDGSTSGSGASISFAGTATDPEDGALTGALVWTSSIDGQIGVGGSFTATLSDGTHGITAKATDSGGKTGSALIGVIVGASGPPAIGNPAIAYGAEGEGLAIISADGSAKKVLVPVKGQKRAYGATWSPDGSQIAYLVEVEVGKIWCDLYTVNADGSNPTLIHAFRTWDPLYPVPDLAEGLDWYPAGNKVMYSAELWSDRSDVHLIDLVPGGQSVSLGLNDSEYGHSGGSFSPDLRPTEGGYQGLVAYGRGSPSCWPPNDIYVVKVAEQPDGSLAPVGDPIDLDPGAQSRQRSPAFSLERDPLSIAFTERHGETDVLKVARVTVDTSVPFEAASVLMGSKQLIYNGAPGRATWSPHATWIAFAGYSGPMPGGGSISDIFRMDPQPGADLIPITSIEDNRRSRAPDWNPMSVAP